MLFAPKAAVKKDLPGHANLNRDPQSFHQASKRRIRP